MAEARNVRYRTEVTKATLYIHCRFPIHLIAGLQGGSSHRHIHSTLTRIRSFLMKAKTWLIGLVFLVFL